MHRPWYISNPQLLQQEKESLSQKYPDFEVDILPTGTDIGRGDVLVRDCVVAKGCFRFAFPKRTDFIDYSVAVVTSDNYPSTIPALVCVDEKIPISLDRHVLSDAKACLGVPSEINKVWRTNPCLTFFLDKFVAEFIYWQIYYDNHEVKPPCGDRRHGIDGIADYYRELFDFGADGSIRSLVEYLTRPQDPKGHEICPCGSGKKIRNCHLAEIIFLRKIVSPADARQDLVLFKCSMKLA